MTIDKKFECIFTKCESIISRNNLCFSIDKEKYDEKTGYLTYFIKGNIYDEWTFIDDVYKLGNEIAKRYNETDVLISTSQYPDGDEYDQWYSAYITIKVIKK